MKKIGVNEPCPCGYPLKFKRCCMLKGMIYKEDFDLLKQVLLQKKKAYEGFNIQENILVGKPIIQTKLRSARGIFVDSGYYIRNERETFQEFLVHQLKHGLGWQWGAHETEKPLDQRHVYIRWLNSFSTLVRERISKKYKIGENLYSSDANGDSLMLLSFAYDIFTLRNANELPKNKIRQLREWNKFQSVRYEIAIAAVFVRAGFKLEWFDDRTTTAKHGEFVGTHTTTGEKIAVEVKSRYRPGTYHVEGEKKIDQIKIGAKNKLNEAMTQIPNNISSMIFIDLNIPMEKYDQKFEQGLTSEIKHIFDDYPNLTKDNPSLCNATIFTNWSWHYFGIDEVQPSTTTIKSFPIYVKNKLSNNVINLLNRAIDEYGKIPFPVFT